MAKIRTIKPEMKSSETVAKLSIHARLLFIWLITEADDEGRLLDNAKTISGTCFPFDEDIDVKDVAGWLSEIAAVSLIRRYRRDEKSIIQIQGWNEHQKISPARKSKSLLKPEFDQPEELINEIVNASETEFDSSAEDPYDFIDDELQEVVNMSSSTSQQVEADLSKSNVTRRQSVGDSSSSCRQVVVKSTTPTMEHGTWNMDHSLESPRVAEALPEKIPKLRIDEIFDAVCEVTHRDSTQMTKSARGSTNRAVSELKAVGASPGEIRSRAAVYRQKFPNIDLSPAALSKHWDSLIPPAPRYLSVQKPTAEDLNVRVQIDPNELDESKWPTLAEIQGVAG